MGLHTNRQTCRKAGTQSLGVYFTRGGIAVSEKAVRPHERVSILSRFYADFVFSGGFAIGSRRRDPLGSLNDSAFLTFAGKVEKTRMKYRPGKSGRKI